MTTTLHEAAAKHLLQRWQAVPEGRDALAAIMDGLAEKRWSRPYMRAIGAVFRAPSSSRGWPLEQVAAFGELHARICKGLVGRALIGVEGRPGRDADREGNAVKLADLPPPFRAAVNPDQNLADQDGFLSWSTPIEVEAGSVCVTVPPGRVPLEIGSTKPSRTLLHVAMDHGVARWPYASEDIHLFVNLGKRSGEILAERWQGRRAKAGA